MTKLFVLPVLIGVACLLAGLYGMIHNQISYTVGPEYFTRFKFLQVHIAEALPYRTGAAIVGWRASWWMGLVIGAPIAFAALFLPDARSMARAFLRVSLLVVAITLALGTASLLVRMTPEIQALIPIPATVEDPAAFARAGLMHDTSYGAGLIGLLVGLVVMIRTIRRHRA
jgi:hypothetical protein